MDILLVIGLLLLLIFAGVLFDCLKMRKVIKTRGAPNICEYARSFDYRNVDTRIMREVWNEVQLSLGSYSGKAFPVKAEDMFVETYNMHSDDLDEIYWAVADRLGIDTESPENNPYYNQVNSVKSLVLFLHNQPRSSNAQQSH